MEAVEGVIRGDFEELFFDVVNPDGSPRNISEDTITVSGKVQTSSSKYSFYKNTGAVGGVTKTDPALGAVKVTFDGPELHDMRKAGTLICDVEVVDPDGRPATTLFTMTVELDVTQPVGG